jgi:hypothetical protein
MLDEALNQKQNKCKLNNQETQIKFKNHGFILVFNKKNSKTNGSDNIKAKLVRSGLN